MLKHRCISAALFALALAGCQGRGLQPQSTSAATPATNDTIPTVTSLPPATEPQSSTTVETTSTTAEIIPETVPVTSPRATVPATTAAVETQRTSAGPTPPEYIKQCESGGNYRAVNPNGHYGAWQFSMSTWRSVGGTGNPADASPAEQDYRAAILWDNGRGASHWECA